MVVLKRLATIVYKEVNTNERWTHVSLPSLEIFRIVFALKRGAWCS